jgi:Reverse transcriptase (RNA-dependent DNA polymerase)
LWYDTCTEHLKALGLSQVKEEPSLWRYKTSLVLFYVDDFFITGSTEELDAIAPLLQNAIYIRDLGKATCFLGIEIHGDDDGGITLGQSLYVEKMAAKYNVTLSSQISQSAFLKPS